MEQKKRPYPIVGHEAIEVGRFKIIKDTISIDGKNYPYSYDDSDDCVVVLPVIEDRIVIIREYRHCLNEWFWEVPAGGVGGRRPEEAARRELLEEAGCTANKLFFLGRYPNSLGTSSSYSYVYAAECKFRGEQSLEKTEFIEVEEIPVPRFEEMIRTREFVHMAGIIAWDMYKNRWFMEE